MRSSFVDALMLLRIKFCLPFVSDESIKFLMSADRLRRSVDYVSAVFPRLHSLLLPSDFTFSPKGS